MYSAFARTFTFDFPTVIPLFLYEIQVFNSCSKWATSQQRSGWFNLSETGFVGGEFSLSSLRRADWGLLLSLPSPNCQANLWKMGNNSWSNYIVYNHLIFFPVEFSIVQIRQLIPYCVHILRTYTWEHFVSHLQLPPWLGVIGTRAGWLFKKSCLWNSHKLQAATWFYWESFCWYFVDEMFGNQSIWIRSKFEGSLNTVVRDWENNVTLL